MTRHSSDNRKSIIHARALRAAAAVAFGTACSSAATSPIAGTSPDTADTSSEISASADVAGDAKAAQTQTQDADAGQADIQPADAQFADSAAGVDSLAGEDMVAGAKPDCAKLGLDMGACCDALQAWCGAAFPTDDQQRSDCIYGENFSGITGCTPWGPPAPPALDWA